MADDKILVDRSAFVDGIDVIQSTTPGYKTSEFWLNILTVIGVIAPGIWATMDKCPWLTAIFAALASRMTFGYAAIRVLLKMHVAGQIPMSDGMEKRLASVEDTVNDALGVLAVLNTKIKATPAAQTAPASPTNAPTVDAPANTTV